MGSAHLGSHAMLCSPLGYQVNKQERINGCQTEDLLLYGVVQLNADDKRNPEARIVMSKLVLRLVCQHERQRKSPNARTYLPPDEILRTIRDYYGDVQELVHVWSFAINFNALASLLAPKPRKLTLAALRPGAMLLEPDTQGQSSLLTEELFVDRVAEGESKGMSTNLVEVVTELDNTDGTGKVRVALHDIVNQPAFTAGLTTANSKGVDGWAIIKHTADRPGGNKEGADGKENVVVLFQTKGKKTGEAVHNTGKDDELSKSTLNGYISSLMASAFESADKRLISGFKKIKRADKINDKRQKLAAMKDDIDKWVKWSETRVAAELLLVPNVKEETRRALPVSFQETAATFKHDRQQVQDALLESVANVEFLADQDPELLLSLAKLKEALKKQPRVPSVLVVFRDGLDQALGDIFGGIVSRTVEAQKKATEQQQSQAKANADTDDDMLVDTAGTLTEGNDSHNGRATAQE